MDVASLEKIARSVVTEESTVLVEAIPTQGLIRVRMGVSVAATNRVYDALRAVLPETVDLEVWR